MPVGACDDCGNALGECTCEGGPEEDLGRSQRGARGHMVVTVQATPDVKRLILEEVNRTARAVVLDAGPKASLPVKHRAKGLLVDLIRHEWADRKPWKTVHYAGHLTAHNLQLSKANRDWRYQDVSRLRALVWLLRLARVNQ